MKAAASAAPFAKFVERCLTLDLEVTAKGRIRDVGALYGDAEFRVLDAKSSEKALRGLSVFADGADCVVGHNIVAHDRRFIEAHLSGAALLDLPVVDTLYLAPLARPERPYHHLVKDYKLVGTERSDPVADSRRRLSTRPAIARRLLGNP